MEEEEGGVGVCGVVVERREKEVGRRG